MCSVAVLLIFCWDCFNAGAMTLTDDQQRLKALLTETVTLLCKNGLHFQSEVSIDGVIGITVDKSNVFLVCIRENVQLRGTSCTKNLPVSTVRQLFQSEDVLFSAPCMASSDPVSSFVGRPPTQLHGSSSSHDSPETLTEPCGDVDHETCTATTRSETSFCSSIAAENQNTELSTSAVSFVADFTPDVNTAGEKNDSDDEAVTDNTSNLLHGVGQEKSVQDSDTETMIRENMSSSHKEVVNIKYEATEQEPKSLESDLQSHLSAIDSDASDMQWNAGTVEMESETVTASSADQQLPFRRISSFACTADSDNQVRLFGLCCAFVYLALNGLNYNIYIYYIFREL